MAFTNPEEGFELKLLEICLGKMNDF